MIVNSVANAPKFTSHTPLFIPISKINILKVLRNTNMIRNDPSKEISTREDLKSIGKGLWKLKNRAISSILLSWVFSKLSKVSETKCIPAEVNKSLRFFKVTLSCRKKI